MPIKASQSPHESKNIRPKPPGDGHVSFSWKFFDDQHAKFRINDRDADYFSALIARMREYCRLSAGELVRSNHRSVRCNKIHFDKSTENGFGIPGEELLVEHPFELLLTVNEHGRMHGFFNGDIYYVRWLDPNHNLFP